jgi:hypothetical protein
MFSVKIVSSPILPDTRCIMSHGVELGKVKMAFVCGFIDWTESLEYNLGLVNLV